MNSREIQRIELVEYETRRFLESEISELLGMKIS